MGKSNTTAGLTVADDLTIDVNSIAAGSLFFSTSTTTTPAQTALAEIIYQNALITLNHETTDHVDMAGENSSFDHRDNLDWSDSDC